MLRWAKLHSARHLAGFINHLLPFVIRAFLRLELHWFNTGISWYEAKTSIVRDAVRAYLACPRLTLSPSA